ncbi:mannosyltransferase family protein [Spirulina sp. CS-785/01]|uniref:mannosyltransferase family protein n=1 Tax=Spirulina sp. CS-785/01 TaxID=3021716 RepID=UPI00232AD231|nr:mannosyltransferase family protein [Spirulina sp. CS-785/01]MDB9314528.1 mannosyltransferase family protein [Spirulina sp. CS-785/01]
MTKNQSFPLLMWGLSRGVLFLTMLGVTPLLPTPEGAKAAEWGLGVFNAWDSQFYESIAVSGYHFQNDGQGYNVAFFPILPLLSWVLMQVGLPFNGAATLVNNLAFLGALLLLYNWVQQRHGETVARWSTAVLAWCPFSIFGTVIYTEGVFLCLSTAALRAFENQDHLWAAFWGALATATRVTGVALIPTFLWAAWRQKRGLRAYLAGGFASAGLILYCLYCYFRFGDFLAFYHSMEAWNRGTTVHWQGWLIMFGQIVLGPKNTNREGFEAFVDPWHPLVMGVIAIISLFLWKSRHRFGKTVIYYGYCVLFLLVWLLVGNPLLNTLMILGGLYLLWHTRQELGIVPLSYGVFSYAIILNSGQVTSLERYVYAIVSVSLAFGLVLSRYPRWGRAVMLFFGLLLILFGLRFAQGQWVA